MSFAARSSNVCNGDTVILFLGHNSMQCVKMVAGEVHQTKFGSFMHDDIIGKAFGSKVFSNNRKGWVHLLHPCSELWTVTLPHRTQILYTTDISLIVLELELKPGSIVVESGTGSGSISHAFVRTIMPSGHLYTFDFHEQRVEQAKLEFEDHGIGEYVTASFRDVISDGFGLVHKADAVFLDLPRPWIAIKFAKEALKVSGGKLCSFSPCIEQVQKTCLELEQSGFCEIKTVECLSNTYDVRTVAFPEAKFSQSNPSLLKTQDSDSPSSEKTENISVQMDVSSRKRLYNTLQNETVPHHKIQKPGNKYFLSSRKIKDLPGHTGYLTFATLLPPFQFES